MTIAGKIIMLFFLILLIVVFIAEISRSEEAKNKGAFLRKMNPIGDNKALKVTPVVFADKNGRGIDETNLFRIYIKGNGLQYKGAYDGDVGLVDIKCETFKKGDIVLIKDWSIWEIKTCHKKGDYTLTKEKNGEKITKIVKSDEICGKLKHIFDVKNIIK